MRAFQHNPLPSVAVLAGGLATRLRPLTESMPKSLIEIAGRPFICHQLEWLRAQGIHHVVLCIGFLGEAIQHLVGSGEQFGLHVEYSLDGETLLGTGGALKRAVPLLGQNFFVLYGDSYLRCDLKEVHQAYLASASAGLMTVFKNADAFDKSNVWFRNGKLIEYNKQLIRPEMHHIDYGLSMLSSSVFDSWALYQPFDLADVYTLMSQSGQLAGFEVFQRFYEIGSYHGIRDIEQFLR